MFMTPYIFLIGVSLGVGIFQFILAFLIMFALLAATMSYMRGEKERLERESKMADRESKSRALLQSLREWVRFSRQTDTVFCAAVAECLGDEEVAVKAAQSILRHTDEIVPWERHIGLIIASNLDDAIHLAHRLESVAGAGQLRWLGLVASEEAASSREMYSLCQEDGLPALDTHAVEPQPLRGDAMVDALRELMLRGSRLGFPMVLSRIQVSSDRGDELARLILDRVARKEDVVGFFENGDLVWALFADAADAVRDLRQIASLAESSDIHFKAGVAFAPHGHKAKALFGMAGEALRQPGDGPVHLYRGG